MKSLTLFVLMLAGATFAADSGHIKGTIADPMGVPIPRALIVVRRDTAGHMERAHELDPLKLEALVRTDFAGAFDIELVPGFYDVFVSSPAFDPQCKKVRVFREKSVEFSPRLALSGAVTDEIGFKIEAAPEPKRSN